MHSQLAHAFFLLSSANLTWEFLSSLRMDVGDAARAASWFTVHQGQKVPTQNREPLSI